MIATDIAIETFFSTCGACAKAGPAARTDAEANKARLERRMFGLPGSLLLCVLLNPRLHELIQRVPRKFTRGNCCDSERSFGGGFQRCPRKLSSNRSSSPATTRP